MNSIGLVEVKNVSKGIVVTDEMLKSAGIVLISSGSVCPGKFVTIVGGERLLTERNLSQKMHLLINL